MRKGDGYAVMRLGDRRGGWMTTWGYEAASDMLAVNWEGGKWIYASSTYLHASWVTSGGQESGNETID
jgi:hypothetical protein